MDKGILNFNDLVGTRKGAFLVCGEGPSLDTKPEEFYNNFDGTTVGFNQIRLVFHPDYYLNSHILGNVLEECKTTQYYQYETNRIIKGPERDGKIVRGFTINRAFSCAYHLGATDIYVIGVDACDAPDGRKTNKWRVAAGIPGIYDEKMYDQMFKSFCEVAAVYKSAGVNLYDLSPWGRLPSNLFTKVKE